MKSMKISYLTIFLSLFVFITGCEDDNTDGPVASEAGTISGSIIFSGIWPDSGDVLLTIDIQYPPQGPPSGSRTIESNEPENNIYTYSFEDLPFGNYAAITVTYWPSEYSSGGTYTLLGSYPNPLILPIQTYINLSEENPEMIIDDIEATF